MPIKIPYDLPAARTLRDENIFVMTLDYYISTRLSGEIEKKSAIRKNPNDTVRRETENPERILETVVSHYILIICPRQISGDEDEAAREFMHCRPFRRTILSYARTDIFGKSSYGRGHSIRRGNRHTQRDALRRI